MKIEEIIEVTTGFRDGKEIQIRCRVGERDWSDCHVPAWAFQVYDYRIKPTPREFWLLVRKDHEQTIAYSCEQKLWDGFRGEQIHVQEVID